MRTSREPGALLRTTRKARVWGNVNGFCSLGWLDRDEVFIYVEPVVRERFGEGATCDVLLVLTRFGLGYVNDVGLLPGLEEGSPHG